MLNQVIDMASGLFMYWIRNASMLTARMSRTGRKILWATVTTGKCLTGWSVGSMSRLM